MNEKEFFTEYGEAGRYKLLEVIGRGSYGVVCSAIDTRTGEKVAIKKITDVFEHVADATRILREIKLLRLLRHPDIVEVKHILLPPAPTRRAFRDIFVVFELMESDLHQVMKANDDLSADHHRFFLYQMLRALKYIHTANVFHRDLKPKNILANADCKLKVCDFGLARVAFSDASTAVFWTDYVATRWYRAPELCGSFFAKYTPAIDIWGVGCIFAEVLTGKPLFPGKNVVHQLELITDLLGTPPPDCIAKVRNEKARRFLNSMRRKPPANLEKKFARVDPNALRLLARLLAFDPAQRPSAEEALADPYFEGLAKVEREPSAQPIMKVEFEFERRRLNTNDVRDLIYREILEYHPEMLKEYKSGKEPGGNYLFPSVVDQFRRQFRTLEEQYNSNNSLGRSGAAVAAAVPTPSLHRHSMSLPRERVMHDARDSSSINNNDSTLVAHQQVSHLSQEQLQRQQQQQRQPFSLTRAGIMSAATKTVSSAAVRAAPGGAVVISTSNSSGSISSSTNGGTDGSSSNTGGNTSSSCAGRADGSTRQSSSSIIWNENATSLGQATAARLRAHGGSVRAAATAALAAARAAPAAGGGGNSGVPGSRAVSGRAGHSGMTGLTEQPGGRRKECTTEQVTAVGGGGGAASAAGGVGVGVGVSLGSKSVAERYGKASVASMRSPFHPNSPLVASEEAGGKAHLLATTDRPVVVAAGGGH